MKKCCFIIPYFGKLPNYFSLFLKTCGYNEDFNWLIITDDNTEYHYPKNVKKINMSFAELKKMIQSKFDFQISLPNPYKLCDFRPAYGFLFEEYLKEFEFWGYCDTDILIGNIKNFITDTMLKEYDKIFCLGHMTIFKNNDNKLFMSQINEEFWYKEVFSNPKNFIFDEHYSNSRNIHEIYLKKGKKVFEEDYSINFKILPSRFIKITYNANKKVFMSDEQSSIYVWENGSIYRYTQKNKSIKKEEYLYIHLQERKMSVKEGIENNSIIKIIPNKFTVLEVPKVTIENFKSIKKYSFNSISL